MAIPKPQPADWIRANAQELKATDKEVLAMLRDASRAVNEELAALIAKDDPRMGAGIRRAQLEQTRSRLLAEQGKVFERLGDIVAARRARAASRSQRLSAAGDAALLAKVGKGAEGQYLYQAALNVSQRAIDVALARMRLSALPLSQRIYKSQLWMDGRLGKLINETLATGLNAREFAKKARDWFSPNTPGGVRYAAMRLARTEINNSFHAISAEKYATTPWIKQVDWNLSGSHPTPDECNVLADKSPFDPAETPARPHPQCMCYITPVSEDEDDFVENFLKGDYDDYLDSELEKNGWQVPEKERTVQPAPSVPKVAPSQETAGRTTPKNIKKGMEVQDPLTQNWGRVAQITVAPGGGSRSGGGRGGQYTFRDEDGNKILSAAPNQQVAYRSNPFYERMAKAAKDLAALAAPLFGLERQPRPAEFTPEMATALNRYTGVRYEEINGFLRGDLKDDEVRDRIPGWIANIDAAMEASKLSEEVVLYRGMSNGERLFGDRLDGDLTGMEWKEDAYVSTSALERRTTAFMTGRKNRVLVRMVVPKGTGAIEASPEGAEAEVLLQRGMGMRVVKDNGIGEDGIRRIDVEAVRVREDGTTKGEGTAGRDVQPADTKGTELPYVPATLRGHPGLVNDFDKLQAMGFTFGFGNVDLEAKAAELTPASLLDSLLTTQTRQIILNSFAPDKLQILRTLDEEFASKTGQPNNHRFEAMVVEFLKTPEGVEKAREVDEKLAVEVLKLKDVDALTRAAEELSGSQPELPADSSQYQLWDTKKGEQVWKSLLDEKPLTPDELKGLRFYSTSPGFGTMNGLLRGTVRLTEKEKVKAKEGVENAQKGLRPNPEPVLVTRVTEARQFTDLGGHSKRLSSLVALAGKTFKDKGFTSTAVIGGNLTNGEVRLEIEVPIGVPMAYMEKLTRHKGENEILLSKDLEFKILHVKLESKDQVIMRVRVSNWPGKVG